MEAATSVRIQDHFRDLRDPRRRKVTYPLINVVVMGVCAVICGAEDFVAREWRTKTVTMTVIAQREELIAWYLRRGYVNTGETAPFPYGDLRFGEPKRPDLHFVVLRKALR